MVADGKQTALIASILLLACSESTTNVVLPEVQSPFVALVVTNPEGTVVSALGALEASAFDAEALSAPGGGSVHLFELDVGALKHDFPRADWEIPPRVVIAPPSAECTEGTLSAEGDVFGIPLPLSASYRLEEGQAAFRPQDPPSSTVGQLSLSTARTPCSGLVALGEYRMVVESSHFVHDGDPRPPKDVVRLRNHTILITSDNVMFFLKPERAEPVAVLSSEDIVDDGRQWAFSHIVDLTGASSETTRFLVRVHRGNPDDEVVFAEITLHTDESVEHETCLHTQSSLNAMAPYKERGLLAVGGVGQVLRMETCQSTVEQTALSPARNLTSATRVDEAADLYVIGAERGGVFEGDPWGAWTVNAVSTLEGSPGSQVHEGIFMPDGQLLTRNVDGNLYRRALDGTWSLATWPIPPDSATCIPKAACGWRRGPVDTVDILFSNDDVVAFFSSECDFVLQTSWEGDCSALIPTPRNFTTDIDMTADWVTVIAEENVYEAPIE